MWQLSTSLDASAGDRGSDCWGQGTSLGTAQGDNDDDREAAGELKSTELQDLSGDAAHLLLLLLSKELDFSGTAGETREGADGVPEVPVGVALSSQKVPEPPSSMHRSPRGRS